MPISARRCSTMDDVTPCPGTTRDARMAGIVPNSSAVKTAIAAVKASTRQSTDTSLRWLGRPARESSGGGEEARARAERGPFFCWCYVLSG
jgi:hypothetical protein